MDKVTITLSVSEWNVVMQSLGNMPFAQVNSIIAEIKSQAEGQLPQPQPAAAE